MLWGLGFLLAALFGFQGLQAAPSKPLPRPQGDQRPVAAAPLPCAPRASLRDDPLAPPIEAVGQPLPVQVRLHIDEIPLISGTEDHYLLDGFLDVAWCDPRLPATLDPGEEERVYANSAAQDFLGTHWEPQITFINELGASSGDDLNLSVFSDGRAELSRRLEVKLESNFDLRDFPFDRQRLEADVASFAWDSRFIKIVDDGANLSVSRYFDVPEWDIKSFSSRVIAYDDPDHGDDVFSLLKLKIDVARKSAFYINKIFMPLAILSFTSIFFLAIPVDAIADRIGFISGLLFTTLAYQLIISSSVPRVPYFTLGDKYTLFLFFFMVSEVFIAYIISIFDRFGTRSKRLMLRAERGFEISLPVIFVVVNYLFFSRLSAG